MRVEATQTFALRAFVPATDVDALYFDHPYYLAPGKGGAKAYRDTYTDVLRQAIKQKINGRPVRAAALRRAAPVTNLGAALEQSLRNPRRHLVALEGGRLAVHGDGGGRSRHASAERSQ